LCRRKKNTQQRDRENQKGVERIERGAIADG
jgi:hypothetical protein